MPRHYIQGNYLRKNVKQQLLLIFESFNLIKSQEIFSITRKQQINFQRLQIKTVWKEKQNRTYILDEYVCT